MLTNVFLFTGEDKYSLHQELKRWTTGFVQKFGADSLFSFDSEHFDASTVRQVLYSGGLFVQKKMVVLYGLPTDGDASNKLPSESALLLGDEFLAKQGQLSPDIILLFVSYKPDKRTKLYKFLETQSTLKLFEPLKPAGLKNFIREHTSGLMWSDFCLEYFLAKVGNDLFHISHECEKLLLFCASVNSKEITQQTLDLVCFGLVETNSFVFFDLLLTDKQKCLAIVKSAQDEGINWNLFAGTLYRGLKNWIFILDLAEQGISDPKQLASVLKAHPFVVSKSVKALPALRRAQKSIIAFFIGLLELEVAIKSGKKSDFMFWLDLKKLIIRLF